MSYYEKRIAYLEARVAEMARQQRMKAIPVEAKLLERYALMQAENSRLKAEVERLRKVGDEMASLFGGDYSDHDGVCYDTKWNAAKEGKV